MMPRSLYIVDGHAHIYAAYYAPMRPLTSPSGEPTKAVYIFTNAILGLIKNYQPDMLVVTMDSKAPTFRSDIYKEYKAHRPPMPDDMPSQIKHIEQILAAMNIPMLRLDGYEADDIIGTLAKKSASKDIDAYICTKDKDILQLINEHVFTFDIKTGQRTDADAMKKKMGITPEQFIDCLSLAGDTADNIPGVPDVGIKTAISWIQKYGSLDNLFEHAHEIKGKRGDSLRNSSELVEMSKKLVTIDCSVPIDIDYDKMKLTDPDKETLSQKFTELGFSRLITQLGLKEISAGAEDDHKEAHQPIETASAKTVKHDYVLVDTQEKFSKFFAELKKQKIFAIDTETDSIEPMRATLVGMSFSWQSHKAFYLPIKAPLGSKTLPLNDITPKLAPILADKNIKKIGQNIKYDMLVLQNAGLPLKGIYVDTMIASYCLDPLRSSHSMDNMALDFLNYQCVPISALIGKGKNQLTFDMVDTVAAAEYAAEDADITFQLYEYLRNYLEKQPTLKKLFEDIEMPLVPVLAAMEYNGVSLDRELLTKMSGDIEKELKIVSDKIYAQAGYVFNIDSPKQLAEVLFDHLGLKPLRIGKAGRSTNAAVLEQLAQQHPLPSLTLEYRTLSKLQNTYANKLGSLINPRTNRVHASFNQTVTATGRLSSSNPNLQNIPIRTELGKKIRSAFIPADENDYILSADYSQIELRLLAHFSRDPELIKAFAEDTDIHSFVASQIYGVPIDDVSSEMRSSSKAINFGIIYGQGAFGLSRTTGMSMPEAKKFIDDYFDRYRSIRKFMDDIIEKAKSTGYAETILNRRRKIASLTDRNSNKRAQAERFVVNTVIQGSAADLIKVAMINIQNRIEKDSLPVKMILQIHDELVFELPKAQVKQHSEWIAKEMTTAIKLDTPMKVDITAGPSWLGD